MVRQARRYLAGAASSAALIAVAIVAFVLLVSAEAFKQWPIAGLGSDESAAVAPSHAVRASASVAPRSRAARPRHARHGGKASAKRLAGAGTGPGGSGAVADLTGSGAAPTTGGSGTSKPAPTAKQPAGAAEGGPAPTGGSSGGGGNGSSGGGGAGTGKVTGTVAETVNGTVSQVNGATGGTLEQAGVTQVTESATEAVPSTEANVGQVVNRAVEGVEGAASKTVEGVGGLVEGGR